MRVREGQPVADASWFGYAHTMVLKYGTGMAYHFELLKLGGLAVLKQCWSAGALILAIQSASSKHAGSASSTAAKPQTTQQ